MEVIRIAIVEDQHLFRQSLLALIRSFENCEVVLESANGEIFLQVLQQKDPLPHIVIADMNLPGINGIELNRLLQRQFPTIKLIVLSVHVQERLIAKMINAGASAYLNKNCDAGELLTAILSVHKSDFYFNTQTLSAIQNTALLRDKTIKNIESIPVELTNREREVLQLICKEFSNTEIAEKLFISSRTVEGHRTNLLLKTGCRNTAGLVLFAVKYGVFELFS